MKINKPNWRNGNVVGAFYNGNLWKNNISQIQLAVYDKDKIVGEEIFETPIVLKFKNNLKLIASLKTRKAILSSDGQTLDKFSIDYQIVDDGGTFILLKILFDLSNNEIELKAGNHYFMIFFENDKTLINSLKENEILITEI